MIKKPLGIKAYGSIPHLPGSRMGPGDHKLNDGQYRACCEKLIRPKDLVVVQEKLDGSCMAILKLNEQFIPLSRAGYRAETSKYEQHQLFTKWVFNNLELFSFLEDGERVVGEWLAQAHGTRYKLKHDPFVAFDIMIGHERLCYYKFKERIASLPIPHLLNDNGPCSIENARELLGEHGHHGAIDPAEGIVWRYERNDRVLFLAKWVREDKKDGCYLSELTGEHAIWNWYPSVNETVSIEKGEKKNV